MKLATFHRLAAALLLGFSSGLPLALSGAALQAWLTVAKVDLSTVGFFALVGLPYTLKFLWAPLMDRFEPPVLGRRRGWIVLTQLGLAGTLFGMSSLDPATDASALGAAAALLAFFSASQDVVIDAWRTDVFPAEERGAGASNGVLGYRLAMILSGGIALVWADPAQGGAWDWPAVYRLMAGVVAGCALLTPFVIPRSHSPRPEPTPVRGEVLGFLAVLVSAGVAWAIAEWPGARLGSAVVDLLGVPEDLRAGWSGLVALLVALAAGLPLGAWLSRRAGYATLHRSLDAFLAGEGAAWFLVAIVLYKLGDAFAGALTTPFLMTGLGFAQAEIGVVNKVFGVWLTVLGALAGGAILAKVGLYRSLLWFGILQLASNAGFLALALVGRGALGSQDIQPFDFGLVWLLKPATLDYGLLLAIALENLTGGMGTAAFVAFLMALCRRKFAATQYALLSALASVGRVWVGPLSGVLAKSIGWPAFFGLSMVAAVPGLLILVWLAPRIRAVERDEG